MEETQQINDDLLQSSIVQTPVIKPGSIKWIEYESVVIGTTNKFYSTAINQLTNTNTNNEPLKKFIVLFDLDNTIIESKSGKFPINSDDWKFCLNVNLLNKFAYIVIFTNQLNIKNQPKRFANFKQKIENIVTKIKPEVQIFISTEDDKFRKPSSLLYTLFDRKLQRKLELNNKDHYQQSQQNIIRLFIGDSCTKFNSTDLKFALNSKLTFLCPLHFEMIFNDETPDNIFVNCGCLISSDNSNNQLAHLKEPDNLGKILFEKNDGSINNIILEIEGKYGVYHKQNKDSRIMIMLVGMPSSGKSYIANQFEHFGYKVFNGNTMDELLNKESHLTQLIEFEKYLETTKIKNCGVIIDRCNSLKKERSEYIKIANRFNCKCICLKILNDTCMCKLYNYFNERINKGIKRYPKKVFSQYFKLLESNKLTQNEGFVEIIQTWNYPNKILLFRKGQDNLFKHYF